MKRRITLTLIVLSALAFAGGREIHQVEKDVDYINDNALASYPDMKANQVSQSTETAKAPDCRKKKMKRGRHPVDPEKIFEDADYLVKIRIFKVVTIPVTNQTIPRDTGGFGSGTIVKCKKYKYCVLTAYHVVDDPNMVYFAEPKDGSAAKALELISGTTNYDNALLHFVDAKYVPKKTAKLGRSSILKAGAPIHAMGSNRFGDFWNSPGGRLYTTAKLANPTLKNMLKNSGMMHSKLLLFNTPIFHGFSGGPLHNKYGEVVGVTIGYTTLDEEPIYIGSPIDEIRKIQKLLR